MIIPTGQMKTLRQRKDRNWPQVIQLASSRVDWGLDPMSQVSVLYYFISRAIKMFDHFQFALIHAIKRRLLLGEKL